MSFQYLLYHNIKRTKNPSNITNKLRDSNKNKLKNFGVKLQYKLYHNIKRIKNLSNITNKLRDPVPFVHVFSLFTS